VVIPVKSLERAKSRLQGVSGPRRQLIALAFARHTLAVASACPAAGAVHVVTADGRVAALARRLSCHVIDEGFPRGLNGAVELALRQVRRMHGGPVAVLAADLPALTPGELESALVAAARWPRAAVADADGVGTVMLTARRPETLHPVFGGRSFAVHVRQGHVALDGAWPGLRRDVDTSAHLADLIAVARTARPLPGIGHPRPGRPASTRA